MTTDDITKRAALHLLRQGLGVADVARMAGRSRQIVAHWEKSIGRTRAETLKLAWDRAVKKASKTA